jgi:hypothetical protein
VLDPTRWVQRLRDWAMVDGSCYSDGMDDDPDMRQERIGHPGSYMLRLLRYLGLKPYALKPYALTPYALFAPGGLPAEFRDCAQLCSRTWVLA